MEQYQRTPCFVALISEEVMHETNELCISFLPLDGIKTGKIYWGRIFVFTFKRESYALKLVYSVQRKHHPDQVNSFTILIQDTGSLKT